MLEELSDKVFERIVETAREHDSEKGAFDPQLVANERAYKAVKQINHPSKVDAYIKLIESYDGPDHLDEWDSWEFVAEHYKGDGEGSIERALKCAAATAVQHRALDKWDELMDSI